MESIWHGHVSLDDLHKRQEGTFGEQMGIRFLKLKPNGLLASMVIKKNHLQPAGIMHGGISCVFAETVGSSAANLCVDRERYYCVGLEINTNHIGQAKKGLILAHTSPFHLGRSTQVWHIEIKDENDRLISINRLTMAVLAKKNGGTL